jgi:hypothetical protein
MGLSDRADPDDRHGVMSGGATTIYQRMDAHEVECLREEGGA